MSDWTAEWQQPREVSDVEVAFPAHAPKYMPAWDECEGYLAMLGPEEEQKWRDFQRTWFYKGLPDTFQVALRTNDGVKVDGAKAFRHLKVIQGSFAPKHEHKEAAVATLAHMWFQDYSFEGFEIEEESSDTAS